MAAIRAWAALEKSAALQAYEYEPGPLGDEDVEIAVEHCGICHSDLSMLDNEWKRTRWPLVPGHEIVGRIAAVGAHAKGVKTGDRVGLGWIASSCLHCMPCLSGDQHMCTTNQPTIVGRNGGFADRVRCHWVWAVKLPDALEHASAGPLFCGGITVFTPIAECGVQPMHRVGVVGIGGLGHLALKFLRAWGCEVTAFTSSASKRAEAQALGAHHVVASNDQAALKKIAGSLDFILVTVAVALDWPAYVMALAPRGRLHFVGAVQEPINITAGMLFSKQRSVSGSPVGSPARTAQMLEFCARHGIAPQIEEFPMSRVNDAIAHLRDGKARYRVVLRNDFQG